MEQGTDFVRRGPTGIFHEMRIAPRHGRGAVPQQLCQGQFMFSGQCEPAGIGMPQCVEYHSETSVALAGVGWPIESKIVYGPLKRARNLGPDPARKGRKNKRIHWAGRQAAQRGPDIICHNRVARLPGFTAPNKQGSIMGSHITPAQSGNLAKSEPAMQRNEGHAPYLAAAFCQVVQQSSSFFRGQVTLSAVVLFGQLDLGERHWAVIHLPCRHPAHNAPDQAHSVAYGLRRIAAPAHTRHEQIQFSRSDTGQLQMQKRLQRATDQCFRRAGFFALGVHPIAPVCLPCGRKSRAWRRRESGFRQGGAFGTDTRYQLDAQLVSEQCRHTLAGPSDDLPMPLALGIAVVYDKTNIRLAMEPSACALRGEDAIISRRSSLCHLVPVWCPGKLIGAQKVSVRNASQCFLQTAFAYGQAGIDGYISPDIDIDNGLFSCSSSSPRRPFCWA